MAEAKTDSTRINEAAWKASSNWLLLEDVFQRWRARLGLGQEAVEEVYALLCNRETRSQKWRVDTSGEEIPNTLSFLNAQFWQERPCLSVVPDADGVGDRLGIDYMDYVDVYSLPNERMAFSVRRLDVERWEGSHPELAAPPSTAAPAVSEVATQDVSREAQDVDSSNTGADSRPTDTNPSTVTTVHKRPHQSVKGRGSRQQRLVQQIVAEEFPDGCEQIETGVIIHKVASRLERQGLPVPKRDTFLRALGRRKD
jgi:hypothetical protein